MSNDEETTKPVSLATLSALSTLSRFDARPLANAGVKLYLKNPEDMGEDLSNPVSEETDKRIWFLTHGTDSDRFIKANNSKRADEMGDVRKNIKYSQSLVDTRVRSLVSAGVSSWGNVPKSWVETGSKDDTPIEYTVENCTKLFSNQAWVQEQVDSYISDRKNYFGSSEKK